MDIKPENITCGNDATVENVKIAYRDDFHIFHRRLEIRRIRFLFGACEKVTTCARIELTTLRTQERLDIIHAEGVQCLERAKNCAI